MTEGFAHSFGPNVRVNCIMCGTFFTDISKAWDMATIQKTANSFALRRGGEPHEIIGAALYFASRASTFCTGAILRLDGGVP
jgi:NAD(P)-dependent dehydrogenase (short-subunit alcohol dehydrogenase family)